MRKMNRNNRTSDRLHRILAGLLAAMMVCGLVVGSGSAVPVRAAEAETEAVEAAKPAEKEASAEKEAPAKEEKAEAPVAAVEKAEAVDETAEEKEEAEETEPAGEEALAEAAASNPDGDKESANEAQDDAASEAEGSIADNDAEGTEEGSEAEETEETEDVEPSLFERLMAAKSADEYKGILGEYSEEDLEAYEAELTEEQSASLLQKMRALGMIPGSSKFHGNTHAGPVLWPSELLIPAVPKRNTKKLLMKNTRGSGNGIEVDKKAEKTGDDEYTITLEVYTTGKVTVVTEPQPADIVLVLDTSGSMSEWISVGSKNDTSELNPDHAQYYRMIVTSVSLLPPWIINNYQPMRYTNGKWQYYNLLNRWVDVEDASFLASNIVISKIDSLKIAAKAFVEEVEKKAKEDNVDHRIAIVRYASDASTPFELSDVVGNKDSIYSKIDSLSANGATAIDYGMNQAKVVLDGIPESRKSGKVVIMFTDGEPTHGNSFSNTVANDSISKSHDMKQDGVTVYSVGVYDGTPSDQIRTFMDYFSSNYKNATSMTNGGSRTGSDYFLKASNAAEITAIFKSIANAIQTPTISLTEETTVKDIVTPQFTLPENTSEINIYTDESTGGENFANNRQQASGVDLAINGSTLTVKGFDFNENFVSETAKDGANDYGRKLIIEFIVKLDPDYLGGTGLATNGPESGVVDPDGNTVATFDVPHVDIPLKKIEPVAEEWNVYASTEEQLADAFKTLKFNIGGKEVKYDKIFNGVNNAGADVEFDINDSQGNVVYTYVIEAGKTTGSWQNGQLPRLTDKNYTVECIVMDHNNVNNKEKATATINVNVFKPILKYDDKHVYYKGNQLSSDTFAPSKTEWKCGDKLDTSVTMDTIKPELTFTYAGPTDTTVDQTEDYTVAVTKVGVENTDKDLTAQATFLRNCTKESLDGASATADEAFKIHVYTPSLAFEDMEKYYGESITFTAPTPTWDNTGVTMDNTAPALSVDVTPADGAVNDKGYVAVKADFNVKAVVKAGETDITQTLIDKGKITRTCDKDTSHTAVSTDCAFVVHVKTVTLDVTKQIEGAFADKTAKYNFTVIVTPDQASGLQAVTETKELGNGDKLEMEGLPKGASVTVTEAAVPTNYTVTATLNDTTARVSGETDKTVTGTLTADENHIVVTNKLESVPITGVDVPVIYLELLMAGSAALGIALVAYAARRKREVRSR